MSEQIGKILMNVVISIIALILIYLENTIPNVGLFTSHIGDLDIKPTSIFVGIGMIVGASHFMYEYNDHHYIISAFLGAFLGFLLVTIFLGLLIGLFIVIVFVVHQFYPLL